MPTNLRAVYMLDVCETLEGGRKGLKVQHEWDQWRGAGLAIGKQGMED